MCAMASPSTEWTPSPLRDWCTGVDRAIQAGEYTQAIRLLRVVLARLPRHLPSYERLLHLIWWLKRWDEGVDWSRRLLRADPHHELPWVVWARSLEHAGEPERARRIWQRALEYAPYSRVVREGVLRTHVGVSSNSLTLTRAALATLYRHGQRWAQAAALYRGLVQAFPARLDLRCALLEALWRGERRAEALETARALSRSHPDLYLPWLVMDRLGDPDDRALARAPLAALDVDREYARARFEELVPRPTHAIAVAPEEQALLAP